MKALRMAALVFVLTTGLLNRTGPAKAAEAITDLVPASTGIGPPVAGSNHGWEFTPNLTISVTHLGLFDYDGDGLSTSHPIGLWKADGTLLAWSDISSGTSSPLLDGYRYVSILEARLDAGEHYVISFFTSADFSTDLMITRTLSFRVDPAITYVGARWGKEYAFQLPSNSVPSSNSYPHRFGPNFQFVPEPTTISLLVLAGVRLIARRNRLIGAKTGH